MPVTIEPEPSEEEREAIIGALPAEEKNDLGGWARAALDEGVEEAELGP